MFSHCWHLLKAKFCNALFAFHKALKKDCEPWRTLCWKGLLNTQTPNVENLPGTKLFSEHNEMNSVKGSWHLICKTVIHSGECMRRFWQIDIFWWHASFPECYLFGQLTCLICTLFPWYMWYCILLVRVHYFRAGMFIISSILWCFKNLQCFIVRATYKLVSNLLADNWLSNL